MRNGASKKIEVHATKLNIRTRNLFELLRAKRAELTHKQGVPAYIIFGDKSLKDMASRKPTTRTAFAEVFGVGEYKLKIYAEQFIGVIKDQGK